MNKNIFPNNDFEKAVSFETALLSLQKLSQVFKTRQEFLLDHKSGNIATDPDSDIKYDQQYHYNY